MSIHLTSLISHFTKKPEGYLLRLFPDHVNRLRLNNDKFNILEFLFDRSADSFN